MSAWSTYRQDGTIKVRYARPMEVVMDLSSGYEDVLAQVQIRAFTDLPSGISYYPDNGWSFITPIFARGTPDLTPITLAGSRSDDVLYGVMGDDTLTGGNGDDVLTGGKGADIFIFHRPDAGTRHADSVTDFELGVDKIRIGEDLLAGANLSPTFNHEEETLTSLTISHFTEPDWAKLLQGFISGGITSDELQQATAHVSAAHFNSSRMTLSFDDVSAQDLTAAIHDAGSLNALLFDVV